MKIIKLLWLFKTKASLILLMLSCTLAGAQQKRINGKITNAKDVEGVHILNLSSRYNSVSDKDGNFYISVKPLDTLLISSVNYELDRVVITSEIFTNAVVLIELKELVNQLAEVYLGPNLTGDLERDLKRIKVADAINFDDVGIPGFKGKPEEKISPIVPGLGLPTVVDVEAMYKHLSGYYRKLKLKRKWDRQNSTVILMIHFYTSPFFEEAYGIPKLCVYDFLLFCMETSEIQKYYFNENYSLVLTTFEMKAKEYVTRLQEKKE